MLRYDSIEVSERTDVNKIVLSLKYVMVAKKKKKKL